VWVQASDYGSVFYRMNEEVYKAFAQEGLSIPFPQMGVHIEKA
jgi:small conductance mechanosensitive channel